MGAFRLLSITTVGAIAALLGVCLVSPHAYNALQARAVVLADHVTPHLPTDLSPEVQRWAAKALEYQSSFSASINRACAWMATGMQAWKYVEVFDLQGHIAPLWNAASEAAATVWAGTSGTRNALANVVGSWLDTLRRAMDSAFGQDNVQSVVTAAAEINITPLAQRCVGILILGLLSCQFLFSRWQRRRAVANQAGTAARSCEPIRQLQQASSKGPPSTAPLRSRVASPPPRAAASSARAPLSDISTQMAKETATPRQPLTEADVLAILNNDDPMKLKGIGSMSSEKILKYRSSQGSLEKIDDLVSKVGIARGTVMIFKRTQGI